MHLSVTAGSAKSKKAYPFDSFVLLSFTRWNDFNLPTSLNFKVSIIVNSSIPVGILAKKSLFGPSSTYVGINNTPFSSNLFKSNFGIGRVPSTFGHLSYSVGLLILKDLFHKNKPSNYNKEVASSIDLSSTKAYLFFVSI